MKLKRGPIIISVDPNETDPVPELTALVRHYVCYYRGNVEVIDWPEGMSWRAKAERVRRATAAYDEVTPMTWQGRVYLTRPS